MLFRSQLKRLQRVNEKRLLSHLKIELKKMFNYQQADLVAHGIASLIDGIWLRGTLNPEGIDANKARTVINDYIEKQLSFYSKNKNHS